MPWRLHNNTQQERNDFIRYWRSYCNSVKALVTMQYHVLTSIRRSATLKYNLFLFAGCCINKQKNWTSDRDVREHLKEAGRLHQKCNGWLPLSCNNSKTCSRHETRHRCHASASWKATTNFLTVNLFNFGGTASHDQKQVPLYSSPAVSRKNLANYFFASHTIRSTVSKVMEHEALRNSRLWMSSEHLIQSDPCEI